jgi:hypothetical protein
VENNFGVDIGLKMKIEILDYVEDDDGGATVTFDLDDAAKRVMIAEGLIAVLHRSLQYLEDMHEYEETTEEKKDED